MLTVSWCSTSYAVIIVFWLMLIEPIDALGRWWLCACLRCVSGLRRLEWNFIFLRCIHVFDLVLKFSTDINEGNCLQLLFYFLVLMIIVTAVIGIRFFSAVFHVLVWSFLLHFDGNVCIWIPKVIWPWMDWFCGFSAGNWLLSSTSYLYGLKSAKDAELLFNFDDISFFRNLVEGY